MKYHIDREVRLIEDSEHKSLYQWSLQEWSSDGQRVGSDQVPWHWTLYFSARELKHVISLEVQNNSEQGGSSLKRELNSGDLIAVSLEPESERPTVYSMFGTDRKIQDISLRIKTVPNGETEERCWIWGGISYTTEINLRDEMEPDSIEIEAYVSADRYAALLHAIRDPFMSKLTVGLKGVSGFYSEWSPSISTSRIKVLTASSGHALKASAECAIEPPRLGLVSSFILTVVNEKALTISVGTNEKYEDTSSARQEPYPSEKLQLTEKPSWSETQQFRESVAGIKIVLWVCAALLAYLAFK